MLILLVLWCLMHAAETFAADVPDVGVFLGVQGTVLMQPATLTAPQSVKPYDRIGPLAVIETRGDSRAKVLFADDTIITLGERSRLEMTEQRYQEGSGARAFVAHLTQGSVRVLVRRPLSGEQSIFEVHSRTAVATVRGTYFVMWIQEPMQGPRRPRAPAAVEPDEDSPTGVANIGQGGDIAFTSGGATVLLLPGQSSVAPPGAPPSMPVAMVPPVVGSGPVAAAVAGTEFVEEVRGESPKDAFASSARPAGKGADLQPAVAAGAVNGQFAGGGYAVPGWPFPVTPVTPPAAVSGAAPASVNPAAGTTVNLSIRTP
jgi:hypothetical protein